MADDNAASQGTVAKTRKKLDIPRDSIGLALFALSALVIVGVAYVRSWTFSLDWRDLLTLASTALAIYQLKQTNTARKALNRYRRRLHLQRGVTHFAQVAQGASTLSAVVISRDWERFSGLTTTLAGNIATAMGTWKLEDNQQQNIKVAASAIRALMDAIPLTDEDRNAVDLKSMLTQVTVLVYSIGEVTGHLKRMDELEEDE